MNDSSFRETLLKQTGGTSVEMQLTRLDALMMADRRYVRRLTIATVVVWAMFVSMVTLSLGLPAVMRSNVRVDQPPQAVSTPAVAPTPPTPAPNPSMVPRLFGLGILGVFISLPPAGVILLVLLISARRTASLTQIQAGLAAIDAQLKLLLHQQNPPPAAPG